MEKKSQEELYKELQEANKVVKVGGVYSHFKHPENLYKVIALGFHEATQKICVIYQAQYSKKLTCIRDLDVWLETPELNGQKVPRFKLVD